MVSSLGFEHIKVEKADAMRRYDRRRKFWKFLPVIEAFVAVLVLFSWLTPPMAAVEFAGEYLRQLAICFNRGIFIFAVVNVLIAVIVSLSHLKKPIEPDFYDQYVSAAATTTTTVSAAVSRSLAPYETDAFEDWQIVASTVPLSLQKQDTSVTGAVTPAKTEISLSVSSVAVNSVPPKGEAPHGAGKSVGEALHARREMVRAVSSVAETVHVRRREMTVLAPAMEAQIYRRSRSERLGRQDHCRKVQRWCAIDDLSSDEFRTTIETFIAAKKKTLLQETMDERRKADVAKL